MIIPAAKINFMGMPPLRDELNNAIGLFFEVKLIDKLIKTNQGIGK
jgi:hypothetical protein